MEYKKMVDQAKMLALPKHIGVIMDGNGRWARKHHTTRINGHKRGAEAVREIVEASVEVGLDYLTVYAFSTENWRRSKQEVHGLLKLIINTLMQEIDELAANNIVVRFIGSKKGLSDDYHKRITENCQKSWKNNGLNLNVAMNYGGKQEIIEAVSSIVKDVETGKISSDDIDHDMLSDYLYTKSIPDPDLLIRTSGEFRLSNFLIWQAAYAELWFTETLWPDFNRTEFLQAILDYQKRQRRFGAT